MEAICTLATTPHALFEPHSDGDLIVALSDGLALVRNGQFSHLNRSAPEMVTLGPDGHLYWTEAGHIYEMDPAADAPANELTQLFANNPQGRQQIACMPDGDIWVEGCTTRRRLDGTFVANPRHYESHAPAPCALDVYGNFWSITNGHVLVLPANASDAWQSAWTSTEPQDVLFADNVGYIWLIGPTQWRRFCPREMGKGWQTVPSPHPQSAVTAVGRSPDELLMVAMANGDLLEINTAADDSVHSRLLTSLPAAARCVSSDARGALWAATNDALYRQPPTPTAWQRRWNRRPGRLPGGGNHDIFSTACQGQLYVAGGWAGEWGLPPRTHVLDELFRWDGTYWRVIDHMPEPRRYCGLGELEGCVWVVGGETRYPHWDGEGQVLYTVLVYNPSCRSWQPGPSLHTARTDPFVVHCNGRIYAIGGAAHNGGPKLDSVESIGPGEAAWRFETPLLEPTRQGHGCELDGIIYCASIDGFYAYDVNTSLWDDDLPQPGPIGQGPLLAAWQGEVWLIGGFGDGLIRCYDPHTRSWRSGPNLPTEQAWGAASVLNGHLVITGGAHTIPLRDNVVFDDRTYVLRSRETSGA